VAIVSLILCCWSVIAHDVGCSSSRHGIINRMPQI
jgi:hypothetical protein